MKQLIIEFAKSTKVSRSKAEAFAQQIVQEYQKANPKSTAGRPLGNTTLALRGAVVQAVKTLQAQGQKATTETIAGVIGGNTHKVYLCNALNYAEKQGTLRRIGKDTDRYGKGKKPVLWGLAE